MAGEQNNVENGGGSFKVSGCISAHGDVGGNNGVHSADKYRQITTKHATP